MWLGIGFPLHLFWEIAQLPLYAVSLRPDKGFIAFAVAHCLVGDLLIGAAVYVIAALAVRDWHWALTQTWRGGAIAVPLGLAYTAWSEWYNVYQAGSWDYLPAMPLIFGIGLSPLMQWFFVPAGTLLLLRRSLAVLKHERAYLGSLRCIAVWYREERS